jgi:hypothetical protein
MFQFLHLLWKGKAQAGYLCSQNFEWWPSSFAEFINCILQTLSYLSSQRLPHRYCYAETRTTKSILANRASQLQPASMNYNFA